MGDFVEHDCELSILEEGDHDERSFNLSIDLLKYGQ